MLLLTGLGESHLGGSQHRTGRVIKHLLPDVYLVCLNLLEVLGIFVRRKDGFSDAGDHCKAMEEQSIAGMTMTMAT